MAQEIATELFNGGEWRSLRRWLETVPKRAKLATYLKPVIFRTTRRKCARCRSDLGRNVSLDEHEELDLCSDDVGGLDLMVDREREGTILNAIQKLDNPQHQRVVLLVFFHGQAIKDVAQALGTSENNVSKMKQRALDRLRDLLPPDDHLIEVRTGGQGHWSFE